MNPLSGWLAAAWPAQDAVWLALAVLPWLFVALRAASQLSRAWQVPWWLAQLVLLVAWLAFLRPPLEPAARARAVLVTDGAPAATEDGPMQVVPGGAHDPAKVAGRWFAGAWPEGVGELTVLGAGLAPQLAWEAGPAPELSVEIWPDQPHIAAHDLAVQVPAGRPVDFEVRVFAPPRGAVLQLRADDAAALARSVVPADGPAQVRLPVLALGRHLLQLRLLDPGGGLLDAVPVAVEVSPPETARILLWQSAPGFEWATLGRWIAASGAQLAVRTVVSDQRVTTRFVNREPVSLATPGAALFGNFDLVIIDGQALGALSAEAREALWTGHDAGVLVLVHDAEDLAGFLEVEAGSFQPAQGERVYQLAGLADALPSGLTRLAGQWGAQGWQTLLEDGNGEPVVLGRGRESVRAVSFLRDSFRVHGAAGAERYARLWAPLISATARPLEQAGIQSSPHPAIAGGRVRVCVAAGESGLSVQAPDGQRDTIALVPAPLRPGERCGWHWPRVSGWYRYATATRSASQYVYAGEAWRAARRGRAAAFGRQLGAATTPLPARQSARQPMRRAAVWPWLLIALLMAWAAQRLALPPR